MDQSPNISSPSLSSDIVQHIQTINESTRRIYLTCLTPPPSPATVSSAFSTPILAPPSPTRSCQVTFRIAGSQSSITNDVPTIKRSEEKEKSDK
ncbi:unnamed protein product [Rotaria sp. Silwood2]|nr:unnamed protein product [Rotaria sp. Silwood2]CAF2975949.1 unnamed protein product [Rotaria sp. Silwood2]CAF3367617.1 unnamed protein product [Rotaria sp. Silwood2]